MGTATNKVKASLNLNQASASTNKPVIAAPSKQTGPLINAITSGLTGTAIRRYAAPPKNINKSHLTANSSLKLLDSCFL